MSHTLIFDIGKTNKKCFVFDEEMNGETLDVVQFSEIEDEDGFPCDDLNAIEKWIAEWLDRMMNDQNYDVRAVNFSTYGASLIHTDENGKPLTPLYNYLKPYPDHILDLFIKKYGDMAAISQSTASPVSGMLNSGLQLFWLKYTKPKVFEKIKWSLHFPQYLSFLYTGKPYSDYTSIGCHTMLWDYGKQDYHEWVKQEGMDKKLAPIIASDTCFLKVYKGKEVVFGVGIHDSSAALYPHILAGKKPFLLISTGTWNVTFNPFNDELLTEKGLNSDCLNYMQIQGYPVRASRIFLGNEHALQVRKLNQYFEKPPGYYQSVIWDEELLNRLRKYGKNIFRIESFEIDQNQKLPTDLSIFDSFEAAYHQLMIELTDLQFQSSSLALGQSGVFDIFIEGGFLKNKLFMELMSRNFSGYEIKHSESSAGPELGAALVVSRDKSGKI